MALKKQKNTSQLRDQEKTVHLKQAKRDAFTRPSTYHQKRVYKILGLKPNDKAAMLVVNTIEFFLEEFT